MSTDASPARLHRAFCIAAVLHAVLIFAIVFAVHAEGWWPDLTRFWVGITTLWFCWPVIIALHAGRSCGRAYLAMAASALLLLYPMCTYLMLFAAPVLVGPFGPTSLHPLDVGGFAAGYVSGWVESRRRSGGDTITLEGYGMGGNFTPGVPLLSAVAAKRYNLQLESTALCGVTPYVRGHAAGYNAVSASVLKRRYGADIMNVLEREWLCEQERYELADEAGRADAQRDIAAGQLTFEVITKAGASAESDMTPLAQHGIALRHVGHENERFGVDVLRHASEYNQVVESEIERRYGAEVARTVVKAATQQALYAELPR